MHLAARECRGGPPRFLHDSSTGDLTPHDHGGVFCAKLFFPSVSICRGWKSCCAAKVGPNADRMTKVATADALANVHGYECFFHGTVELSVGEVGDSAIAGDDE